MGGDSLFGLIDIMIAGGGLYIIVLTIMMMKTGELKDNAMMSKNVDVKKCADVPGYIQYMGPRQIIFGVVCGMSGVLGLLNDKLGSAGLYVYIGCMVTLIAYLFYFSVCSKKALERFW